MTDADASPSPFDQLLAMARQQPEPQRLLFVFARAELPDDATAEQRAAFERGAGGALVPAMSVDKDPAELGRFEALADEASALEPRWRAVFVAALSGRGGQPPAAADVERALGQMVEAIKQGRLGAMLVLGRDGTPMRLR